MVRPSEAESPNAARPGPLVSWLVAVAGVVLAGVLGPGSPADGQEPPNPITQPPAAPGDEVRPSGSGFGATSPGPRTATRLVGDRLTRAAGRQPWPAAATGGLFGGSGAGLAALGRSWAFDMPGGQLLYYRAYVRVFTRGYRPRYRHHHRDDSRYDGSGRQRYGWTDLPRDRTRAVRAITAAAPVLGHHAYTRAVRAHTRVTMASEQVRERVREARAVHQQRARQTGRAVQAQRDARREATEASHQARPAAQPPPGVTEHRGFRRPRASDPQQDPRPGGSQARRADQLPPGETDHRRFRRRRDPDAPQDQAGGGREARRADQLPPGVTDHRLFRRPRDPDPPDWT